MIHKKYMDLNTSPTCIFFSYLRNASLRGVKAIVWILKQYVAVSSLTK